MKMNVPPSVALEIMDQTIQDIADALNVERDSDGLIDIDKIYEALAYWDEERAVLDAAMKWHAAPKDSFTYLIENEMSAACEVLQNMRDGDLP